MPCPKTFPWTVEAAAVPDCYAYWKLDEADAALVCDNEVDAFDLTVFGSFLTTPGKISGAALMGVGAFGPSFRNGPNFHWDFSAVDFTIRGWIWVPIHTGVDRTWISTDTSLALIYEATGLVFYVWSATTFYSVTGVVAPGSWYHVVLYHDTGSEIGIRINNGAAVTTPMAEALLSGNQRFILSSSAAEETLRMDEVAVWTRLLTPAELTNDYNGGTGRTYPDVP